MKFTRKEIKQAEALLNRCLEAIREEVADEDDLELINRIFAEYPGTELELLNRETRAKWIFKIISNTRDNDMPEEFKDFRKFVSNPIGAYSGDPNKDVVRRHAKLIKCLGKIACLRYFVQRQEEIQDYCAKHPNELNKLTNSWLKTQIARLLIEELGSGRALPRGWPRMNVARGQAAKRTRQEARDWRPRPRRVREEIQEWFFAPQNDFFGLDFTLATTRQQEQERQERDRQQYEEALQSEEALQRMRERRTFPFMRLIMGLHNVGRIFLNRPQRTLVEKIQFYSNLSVILSMSSSLRQHRRENRLPSFVEALYFLAAALSGWVLGPLVLMGLTSLPLSFLCDWVRNERSITEERSAIRKGCIGLLVGVELAKDLLFMQALLPLVSLEVVGISLMVTGASLLVMLSVKRWFTMRRPPPDVNGEVLRERRVGENFLDLSPGFYRQYGYQHNERPVPQPQQAQPREHHRSMFAPH